MSRKRYVSTEISIDSRVKRLAEQSEFAALLYTWMIPHAADDATIIADPDELLMLVVPGFRWRTAADIAEAIGQMVALGLLRREAERLRFPERAFYQYQSYIGAERRSDPTPVPPTLNGANHRKSPQTSAEKNFAEETPQNPSSVSFSSSSSSSSSVSSSDPPIVANATQGGTPRTNGAAPRGNPKVQALIDAFKARGLDPVWSAQDYSAAKHMSTAPPELVAEVYQAVADREYGDDFMRRRLSVAEAIKWVNGYVEDRAERMVRNGRG